MREKRKVDQRGSVALAPFGMLGCGGRIFRDCYLETLLDQFARKLNSKQRKRTQLDRLYQRAVDDLDQLLDAVGVKLAA